MRQQQGLTQERLAGLAQVGVRTLAYWEAGEREPRGWELESVLQALSASPQDKTQAFALLTAPRGMQLARQAADEPGVPELHLPALPGLGDLMRSMRIRRGWTQEQFASEAGVSRSTVLRWEATQSLPSEENLERICSLLGARFEEQAALSARSLTPSVWKPELSLEECAEQVDQLHLQRIHLSTSLFDLYALALQRQLRRHLPQSTEAVRLLARMLTSYSGWLCIQDRHLEAFACAQYALELVQERFAPEMFWVDALNLTSGMTALRPSGEEKGVKLLRPWSIALPEKMNVYILCDMALYSAWAGRGENAADLLQRAQGAVQTGWGWKAEEDDYYRLTYARVLISGGRSVEALSWLPTLESEPIRNMHYILIWIKALLDAGEMNEVHRYVARLQEMLSSNPARRIQRRLNEILQQV